MSSAYPTGVVPYLTLAQLLVDQGRTEDAENILRTAYDFAHQKTMPGSYFIGQADSLMGAWLALKEQADEAEPLLIAGLDNSRKSRGDHHAMTPTRATAWWHFIASPAALFKRTKSATY